MGTFNYMSPEQARGQTVDARTDLFSLGVVMHEMIAGQTPFAGETPSDVLAAVLTCSPPPLRHYRAEVPAELERIADRALRKDREQRYQSSKELLTDLQGCKQEWEFKAYRSGARSPARAIASNKLGLLLAVAALLLAGAAIVFYQFAGAIGWRRPGSLAAPPRIVPVTTFEGRENYPSFSPDGNQLAFAWDDGGDNIDIYVKLIGAGAPLRLTTDPAEDSNPAWSPDGRYIAFIRRAGNENGIFLIPALGGVERKVGRAEPNSSGLSWSPDGKFLALTDRVAPQTRFSLYLLSVETLEKRSLTSAPTSFGDTQPAFSPDGRWVAFVRMGNITTGDLYLQPVAGGEPRRLTHENRLINGLAWTADSSAMVFSSNRAGSFNLWRVALAGGAVEAVAIAGKGVHYPAISRQGNRLAYNESFLDSNIWRLEGPGAAEARAAGRRALPARLIFSTREDHSPQFSPDGRRIVFVSDRSGSTEIWVCASDGGTPLQLTFFAGPATGSPRWSPDGRQIAFDSRPAGNSDIFVIAADGGSPRALTSETAGETLPSWSHDGRWVYFRSNRSGSYQIWKLPVAGGPAVQVTRGGAFEAFESTDGRLLYYTKGRGPGGIWQAPVEGGEEAPVPELSAAGYWRYWTVLSDGIYFLSKEADSAPLIKFFSFATRQVRPVATPEREPLIDLPGLSLSPDRRWILYAQTDQSVNDIMLVENFR